VPPGKLTPPAKALPPGTEITLTCAPASVWTVATRWAAAQTSEPLQPAVRLPAGARSTGAPPAGGLAVGGRSARGAAKGAHSTRRPTKGGQSAGGSAGMGER
jgi:hypothetical protein